MNPGKMDRRVSIQALTVTRGAAGGAVETYSLLDTVWAERIEEGAREFRSGGALHAEATTLFRIRYRSDVTTKHRLVSGGRFFDILAATEEGRSKTVLLQTKYTEGRT